MSPRLATTVETCAAAAMSTDARDKYFLSYVGEGSPPGRDVWHGDGQFLSELHMSYTLPCWVL